MTTRDRLVLMVAVALAVAGGFWMLVLSPRRHEASDLATQVTNARAQLTQVTQEAQRTPTGIRTRAADAAELARLGEAVPSDDQMASLMYQLQDAAGHAHVVFNSIQPSGSNGAPAGNAQAATPPPTTTTPAPTSTTASPATTAPGATPSSAGIENLSLSLVFDGRYADLQRFLHRVQAFTSVSGQTIRVSGRLLSIDGIALAPAPSGFPHIRATITATAYIAPADQAATATGAAGSATPATGAPTASAPPSSSTASSAPPTTPAMVGAAG